MYKLCKHVTTAITNYRKKLSVNDEPLHRNQTSAYIRKNTYDF